MKPRDYLNKAKESLNSRDVSLQLMPLDLAWRGVCTDGAMFYITNTNSVINLNGNNTLENADGQLVNAATGRWGNDSSNGGTLTLNINGDSISDSIEADDISSVTVNVSGGEFSGGTSGDVTIG